MKKFLTLMLILAITASVEAQPFIVGHRGSYWGLENSTEAFINGAKKGYDYLETDVKVTKDGKHVCCHNDDLTTWGGTLTIASSTLAALQAETLTQTRGGVKYTGRLATLEEYLDICNQYNVLPVIELKWATGINSNDCSGIPNLIKEIEAKGFRNKCIIFTSMKPCLQYIHDNYPDIQLMLLVYDTSFDSSLSWCKERGIHMGVGVGSGVTKAGVQNYHNAGLYVNAWTINSTSSYTTYGNYGCDFITTDYLDPATLPALSTPTTMTGALKADKNSITLSANIGESAYTDITITGSNMSSSLTATSSNEMFSIANNTSFTSESISGTIRITYKPTSEGIHNGTITLKATNKSGKEVTTTIAVTGKCSIQFKEIWNFSETSGNTPSSGDNWASNKTAIRNIAYGQGKLYIINPSGNAITVVDAQTGVKIKDLSTTGVEDGTFKLMDAKVVGDKLIACNLTTASATTLKAYVWDNDDANPREILKTTDLGGNTRVGDCLDVYGDLSNGELLFLSGSNIIRYAISDGVVATSPTVITVKNADGTAIDAGSSPRVIKQDDGKYWIMGRAIYPTLVSTTGVAEQTIPSEVLNGIIDGNEFLPFSFKGKQYAFAVTYATGSSTLTGGRAVLIDASNGWNNAVNVGEYPTNGLGSTRNTSLSSGIEIDINGDEGIEMWIMVSTQGVGHYRYGTPNSHSSSPTLTTSKNSLMFNTSPGKPVSQTFDIMGLNIESDISINLSGDNYDLFTLSASTIDKSIASGSISVTYSPTSDGQHNATITISSGNASPVTVRLQGICTTKQVSPEIGSLTEVWNFSSNTSIPSYITNDDTNYIRSIAFNDGKLYILQNKAWASPKVTIVDAYTGDELGSLSMTGIQSATVQLSCIRAIDGKILGSNAVSASQTLRVYQWDSDASDPIEILNDATHDAMQTGATMTISGNLNDGRLWFSNDSRSGIEAKAYYYTISNGTVNPTAHVIPLTNTDNTAITSADNGRGACGIIPLEDNSFWYDGDAIYPTLFNADGKAQTSLNPATIGNNFYGTAIDFFDYGEKKYLLAGTYESSIANGKFALIDVTSGIDNATSALLSIPANGLGSRSNDQRVSTIISETRNDGAYLDIWVCVYGQGVAYYKYEPDLSNIEAPDIVNHNKYNISITENILNVEGLEIAAINIYNLSGNLISQKFNSQEISIDNIKSGIYIIQLVDINKNMYTSKIIYNN